MRMRVRIRATQIVLGLVCVMYFITYVDRVNIATAASDIQQQLGLTNVELGMAFSAFGYPYLLFQIIGGRVGDRFGARRTLFWCGALWAVATVLTGFVSGLFTLFLARLLLGFGEGATFPCATRAMQDWTPPGRRGVAQGLTHACSRLGNAATPPLIALLIAAVTWRGAFVVLGLASLIWVTAWAFLFRDDPRSHPAITVEELSKLPPPRAAAGRKPVPWGPLLSRMWPATLTYFCYGWCLWLYLNWLPLFFKNSYHMDIKSSAVFASGVFFAGVIGDSLGGVMSDAILVRTGRLRLARLSVVVTGFVGAFLSLLPILFYRDLTVAALCLSGGFFFSELVIGPIWSVPMDIAPAHAGTAAGLLNSGSALAAIVSPVFAGYLIDATGNWYLPFMLTIVVLAVGAGAAFLMHPERPLEIAEEDVRAPHTVPAAG